MEAPLPNPVQLPPFLHHPLRLRRSCRLALQEFRGEPSYVLEDTHGGHFFHLGLREEKIVRALDGSHTGLEILEACARASKEGDPDSLDTNQALMLLTSLQNSRLLEGGPISEAAGPSLLTHAIAKNPLFLKIPLGNPDPLLTRWERRLRWLFHPWALIVAGFVLVAALLALTSDWQRFTDRAQSVLAAENWIWLGVTFLGLKIIHESGHGLICKHFGGRIPDCGLYFMFFTPLTYVDATSSWSFPSKYTRMMVSAAGMGAEIFVAAVAALVWSATETGVLNTIAYNIIISATIITLFFNLNPLLRYDGYYLLTDFTEIPNLYARGSTAAHAWIRWLFFGLKPEAHEELAIGLYGGACIIWRFLLTLSIAIGAIVLLQGLGLILALIYVLGVTLPMFRNLRRQKLPQGKAIIRPLVVSALGLTVLLLPIRPSLTAAGVIRPANLTSIRIGCPGFLRELLVTPGQEVSANELLARLANPDELARLKILETSANLAEAEAHSARLGRDPQLEIKKLELVRGLRAQALEKAAFCATLELRAPLAGMVVGRDIDHLIGSFVTTGTELFAIGSQTKREVHALIPEEYAQMMTGTPGDPVRVFLRNQSRAINGTLVRIEPRANRSIRFPEATALAGGPIPVRQKEHQTEDNERMEMSQPYFVAVVALIDPPPLLSGETCLVRLHSSRSRLVAVVVWEHFERLIRRYVGRSDHGKE